MLVPAVPGPPEQIKVHAMTSDSIMVAWTPPADPNGNIIKYNIYSHVLAQHGSKVTDYLLFFFYLLIRMHFFIYSFYMNYLHS